MLSNVSSAGFVTRFGTLPSTKYPNIPPSSRSWRGSCRTWSQTKRLARDGMATRAAFDGGPVIRPKQLRRRVVPLEEFDDGVGDGGEGNDLGEHGGGGGGGQGGGDGRGGTGDGQGGTGTKGGSSGRSTVDIEDVRIVPVTGTDNNYRVSFTPRVTGAASLRFSEAGDSTALDRRDVHVLDNDGHVITVDSFALTAGRRVTLQITSEEPIGGRAWRLTAVQPATGGRA